jgi:hypothetical protein
MPKVPRSKRDLLQIEPAVEPRELADREVEPALVPTQRDGVGSGVEPQQLL